MRRAKIISLNALTIAGMIGLIPLVPNDYLLSLFYILIITVALMIKYERHDLLILALGFVFMTISEYFFILTGVETFERNSLFGIMPLWLPFLWAYGFIAIKRLIEIIRAD